MRVLLITASLLLIVHANAQETAMSKYLVFDDLANFWKAYDKVVLAKDSSEQVKIIQSAYLDKASFELKLTLILEHRGAADYLASINAHPAFWKGLRERTRYLMSNYRLIDDALRKLKLLYSKIDIPDINFALGYFDFGGRTFADKVMIFAEVILADGNLDASKFPPSLENYQHYVMAAAIYYALHEVIHTRQHGFKARDLLAMCIMEGSCDFIAELAMAEPLQRPYLVLGNRFEERLWEAFKKEMNGSAHDRWLYNKGHVPRGEEDLGYFMGYAICKYYYYNSSDKKKAIRRILNLNYNSSSRIYEFFQQSGYENKVKTNEQ